MALVKQPDGEADVLSWKLQQPNIRYIAQHLCRLTLHLVQSDRIQSPCNLYLHLSKHMAIYDVAEQHKITAH